MSWFFHKMINLNQIYKYHEAKLVQAAELFSTKHLPGTRSNASRNLIQWFGIQPRATSAASAALDRWPLTSLKRCRCVPSCQLIVISNRHPSESHHRLDIDPLALSHRVKSRRRAGKAPFFSLVQKSKAYLGWRDKNERVEPERCDLWELPEKVTDPFWPPFTNLTAVFFNHLHSNYI